MKVSEATFHRTNSFESTHSFMRLLAILSTVLVASCPLGAEAYHLRQGGAATLVNPGETRTREDELLAASQPGIRAAVASSAYQARSTLGYPTMPGALGQTQPFEQLQRELGAVRVRQQQLQQQEQIEQIQRQQLQQQLEATGLQQQWLSSQSAASPDQFQTVTISPGQSGVESAASPDQTGTEMPPGANQDVPQLTQQSRTQMYTIPNQNAPVFQNMRPQDSFSQQISQPQRPNPQDHVQEQKSLYTHIPDGRTAAPEAPERRILQRPPTGKFEMSAQLPRAVSHEAISPPSSLAATSQTVLTHSEGAATGPRTVTGNLARPKGWDQCMHFARTMKQKEVAGREMVQTWEATCLPAVRSGRASESYQLMCNSLAGAVEPFASQARARSGDHGIERICKDPSVSASHIYFVAFVRSTVFHFLVLSAIVSLWLLRDFHIGEGVTMSKIKLMLDLCNTEGPLITGTGTDPFGFINVIERQEMKAFIFEPVGFESYDLPLPTLRYWQSEEFYSAGDERSMGYSWSLSKVNQVHFSVQVPESSNFTCVQRLSKDRHLRGHETPTHWFGKAVIDVIAKAERRLPRKMLLTTPRAHGALLVWEGPERIWSSSLGEFSRKKFKPSSAWKCYWWTTHILRVSLTAAVLLVLSKFVYHEWNKGLEVWIVQYEYLWENADPDERVSVDNQGLPHFAQTFKYRFQACTIFFILDHIFGDPQGNAEDLLLGIVSAIVQAILMILLGLLPVVHGIFFADWKTCSFVIVVAHLVTSAMFAASYYWALPWSARRPFFLAHCFCATACMVYSTWYFCSVAIFLATRLIVDPGEVCGYAVALATIIIFIIVGLKRLTSLRGSIVRQLEGRESRGAIISFLRSIGLDIKTMILTVFIGVVLIILLAALVIFVGELHFTSRPFTEMVAACATPIVSFVGTIDMLKKKQDDWDKLSGKIQHDTLNIL